MRFGSGSQNQAGLGSFRRCERWTKRAHTDMSMFWLPKPTQCILMTTHLVLATATSHNIVRADAIESPKTAYLSALPSIVNRLHSYRAYQRIAIMHKYIIYSVHSLFFPANAYVWLFIRIETDTLRSKSIYLCVDFGEPEYHVLLRCWK